MRTVLPLVVLAAALLGLAFFFLFGSDPGVSIEEAVSEAEVTQSSVDSSATRTEDTESVEDFAAFDTLASISRYGQNLECVISYNPSEFESTIEGTYFVAGNLFRGDFILDSAELGTQIVTSVINDGSMLYVWSDIDGKLYGTKATLSEAELLNTPVPFDEAVEYDCRLWNLVDGGVFIPPSNVLFRDANELQGAGMEYGTVYEEGEF